MKIWGFQHGCKSVGVGERQENSSLTNNPRQMPVHALERYSKGLYAHQKITEIHEAVLEILRGGMLHQVRFGYVGKDGGQEVAVCHKMA